MYTIIQNLDGRILVLVFPTSRKINLILYTLDIEGHYKTVQVYKFIPTGFDQMSSSKSTQLQLIWNIEVCLYWAEIAVSQKGK